MTKTERYFPTTLEYLRALELHMMKWTPAHEGHRLTLHPRVKQQLELKFPTHTKLYRYRNRYQR